jgi:hypothetical protein
LDVYANDNNNLYQTDGYTDASGNYVLGVLGLGSSDSWYVQANGNNQLTNYIFTQENINGNINAGQAVLQNFTAILATNHITGYLRDNLSNPIASISVYAHAPLNGTNFNAGNATTDASGNYTLNVFNGTWTVGVNSGGGSDSLPGNYLDPANQSVVISNNNVTANFIAILATNTISGYLKDNSGNPIAGVGVGADVTINSVDFMQYVDTDANGNYSFNVANGTWSVGVNPGGSSDSLSGNYLCPAGQTVVISNNNATVNFTAILATNYITGNVKANGTNIVGVGVGASAIINSVDFMQYVDTDANGNYSFNVANGTWSVGLNPSSGSDSLDSILGSGTYQYPDRRISTCCRTAVQVKLLAM